MAKRYLDTDIFKKGFIKSLQGPYKVLWLYIITDCNHAGVWEVELDVAGIRCGFDYDQEETKKAFGDKIVEFDNGQKWFIPSFIDFQYGTLKESNRVHESVIQILKKHDLYKFLNKTLTRPLQDPLQGAKDKDKDKEKDKDKDKDKEKAREIIFPFDTDKFKGWWKEWKGYKHKEHDFKYKSKASEQAALKKLANMSQGDESKAIQLIEESMANGWKGFFELKNNGTTKATGNEAGANLLAKWAQEHKEQYGG